MKFVKSLLLSLSLLVISFIFASQTLAQQDIPDFPACSNPTGVLRISYADGQHAVVGESSIRVGNDAVYDIESGNILQCFCSVEGSGIQTNWWKISSLDQEEIDTLVKLGWYFVPSGADWGLDDSAYMAFNSPYACGGGFTTTSSAGTGAPICTADRPDAPVVTSIVRNGSSATISWTKVEKATHYTIAYGPGIGNYPYGVPNTGNVTSYTVGSLDPNTQYYFVVYAVNDCMPSEPSSGGQVLGTSVSSILGLASTGNLGAVISFAIGGIVSILAGFFLRRKTSSKI